MKKTALVFPLLTALGLGACSASGPDGREPTAQAGSDLVAPVDTPAIDATAVDSTSQPTGPLLIVGTVKDGAAVGVPGVTFTLTGPANHAAVSNSFGVYQFPHVPTGSYRLRPSKSGATFSPSSGTFTTGVSVEEEFRCVAGCEGAVAVSPFKELMIVDPSVTGDARASNLTDGAWSFRFLMEQMTPKGVHPSDFVLRWLQGFHDTAGPINGFDVDDRDVDGQIIAAWPTLSDGRLDLSQAPFKLLAIANRTDLHVVGDGETRLVFGISLPNGSGEANQFTVIFEYRLPVTDAKTGAAIARSSWISQFHALGGLPFGSTYNARLQAITDQFTRAGTTPANPNGSSISQVRTNEILLGIAQGNPWQLREFHLLKDNTGNGFLTLSETAQTPDQSQNDTVALASYVAGNRLTVVHGLATVPPSLIGGQIDENFSWSFTSPNEPAVDERARHEFAGQTCNGCHSGETAQIDGFYHISPITDPGPDGTANLSTFIKSVEIPRRRRFMQNRLVCTSGANCSPGAEPKI